MLPTNYTLIIDHFMAFPIFVRYPWYQSVRNVQFNRYVQKCDRSCNGILSIFLFCFVFLYKQMDVSFRPNKYHLSLIKIILVECLLLQMMWQSDTFVTVFDSPSQYIQSQKKQITKKAKLIELFLCGVPFQFEQQIWAYDKYSYIKEVMSHSVRYFIIYVMILFQIQSTKLLQKV